MVIKITTPEISLKEELIKLEATSQELSEAKDDIAELKSSLSLATNTTVLSGPDSIVNYLKIYDTTLDSEHGQWRLNNSIGKSYAAETLNTVERGPRAEFPSVALLVVATTDSNGFQIYDIGQADANLWKKFNNSTFFPTGVETVVADNAYVVAQSSEHICIFDFAEDSYTFVSSTYDRKFFGIASFNSATFASTYINGDRRISSDTGSTTVYDVAVKVLTGNNVNPTTDMIIPSILVGTEYAVNFLTSSGDLFYQSHISGQVNEVFFIDEDRFFYGISGGDKPDWTTSYYHTWTVNNEPTANAISGQHYYIVPFVYEFTWQQSESMNSPFGRSPLQPWIWRDFTEQPFTNTNYPVDFNDFHINLFIPGEDMPSATMNVYHTTEQVVNHVYGNLGFSYGTSKKLFGPDSTTELILNGDFSLGVDSLDNWEPYYDDLVSFNVTAGELAITATGNMGSGYVASQDSLTHYAGGLSQIVTGLDTTKSYALTVGSTTTYTGTAYPVGNANLTTNIGEGVDYGTGGAADIYYANPCRGTFAPITSTVEIGLMNQFGDLGHIAYFDSVSLVEAYDRPVQAAFTPREVGTLTYTLAKPNCEPVLTSGFSTSNYITDDNKGYYSGRFAPRSSGVLYSFFLKMDPNTAVETVFEYRRPTSPADYVTIEVIATGEIVATFNDVARTMLIVTSGGAAIDDGELHHYAVWYDNNDNATIWQDGEFYSTGSGDSGGLQVDLYAGAAGITTLGINTDILLPLTNGAIYSFNAMITEKMNDRTIKTLYEHCLRPFVENSISSIPNDQGLILNCWMDFETNEYYAATTNGILKFKDSALIEVIPATLTKQDTCDAVNGRLVIGT